MTAAATIPVQTVRKRAIAPVLATTTTIQILSTMAALALTGIAPLVAGEFGLAPHYVGYQISVIYAAGTLASAVVGTMIQRRGPVEVEQIALGCFGIALLALMSGNAWIALAASVVIGVGYGIQNPASAQILGAVTPPHRRSLIFSIKQAGVPIGGVVAALVIPTLAGVIGWRTTFAIGALPCFLMIGVLAMKEPPTVSSAPVAMSVWRGFLYEQRLIWSRAELRALALIGMLYSSLQLSLSAFTVIMLVEHRWSIVAAGLVAAVAQGFGAAGRVSWGGLGDRLGGFRVLAMIGVVSMACMMALWKIDALPSVIVVAVLCALGFCMSGWNGVVMAECTRHCAPQDAGRVVGGALVYTFLGVMIGPAAMATIYGICGDYGTSFLLVSWVAGTGAALAARSMIASEG